MRLKIDDKTLANSDKLLQTPTNLGKLSHLRPGQWTWGGALKQAAAKMRQFLTRWGIYAMHAERGFFLFMNVALLFAISEGRKQKHCHCELTESTDASN